MKSKGFSLVELLTALAIIGILAVVVTASLSGSKQKSRDARRLAELKTLQQAVESFRQDNCQPSFNISNTVSSACDFPSSLNDLVTSSYYDTFPKDPKGDNYLYHRDGKSYCVGTLLELSGRQSLSTCVLVDSSGNPLDTSTGNYYCLCGPN